MFTLSSAYVHLDEAHFGWRPFVLLPTSISINIGCGSTANVEYTLFLGIDSSLAFILFATPVASTTVLCFSPDYSLPDATPSHEFHKNTTERFNFTTETTKTNSFYEITISALNS
ncbi:hypothetical protein TNCV_3539751 [Trichonephila clavipes]|nr:hypothetical protein TNCV_3539751 [Trichonephila clavipes]